MGDRNRVSTIRLTIDQRRPKSHRRKGPAAFSCPRIGFNLKLQSPRMLSALGSCEVQEKRVGVLGVRGKDMAM